MVARRRVEGDLNGESGRRRGPTSRRSGNWVTRQPDTLGVFVTTGTEDFLIHHAVGNNDRRYAFVIDRPTGHPHVADVRTAAVYEHLRNDRITPVRLSAWRSA
jgi:hypothetical protein